MTQRNSPTLIAIAKLEHEYDFFMVKDSVGIQKPSYTGRWGKTFLQTWSTFFLKILTERCVTMGAGSLFQYFTALTENADLSSGDKFEDLCMCIHSQSANEISECDYQVNPKSSLPLQPLYLKKIENWVNSWNANPNYLPNLNWKHKP